MSFSEKLQPRGGEWGGGGGVTDLYLIKEARSFGFSHSP